MDAKLYAVSMLQFLKKLKFLFKTVYINNVNFDCHSEWSSMRVWCLQGFIMPYHVLQINITIQSGMCYMVYSIS